MSKSKRMGLPRRIQERFRAVQQDVLDGQLPHVEARKIEIDWHVEYPHAAKIDLAFNAALDAWGIER